ncbi:MAG: 3-isopropylmalate dehydratase [Candidatus Helarchaeota archaeon]|nr:3-isopropylmalate dehydratase [Candidatus Helarchaeota archaeon]
MAVLLSRKKAVKEYSENIKGKVWVFPDNVDTDVISPARYMDDIQATLKHTCETLIKQFPIEVQEGDIIVAGRNFGCGSSRETAPVILQEKGIVAIIAESFARIFYRTSIARALPVIEVKGISKEFLMGDEIAINIPNAEIINLRTKKKLKGEKIHPILLNLLKNGGLEKQLLVELKESK